MTDQEQQPAEERKIKNVDNQPCGCVVTEYEDGGKQFAPCPPHGLYRVAQCLKEAGDALGAVASTLQREQMAAMQKANLIDTIQKAQADTAAADEADKPSNIMPGPGAN